jgi:DNA-directed RNA polymerase specialized sigma subunit
MTASVLTNYCQARDFGLPSLHRLETMVLQLNIGMAISEARKFSRGRSQPAEDFEQAAVLGLLRALRRFDPERGNLSTLAWIHMRAELNATAVSNAVVRVPRAAWKQGERVEVSPFNGDSRHRHRPGQAATAARVDDRGLASHQAASLAFFLTLATARSRRRRDRWSMNRTPFR